MNYKFPDKWKCEHESEPGLYSFISTSWCVGQYLYLLSISVLIQQIACGIKHIHISSLVKPYKSSFISSYIRVVHLLSLGVKFVSSPHGHLQGQKDENWTSLSVERKILCSKHAKHFLMRKLKNQWQKKNEETEKYSGWCKNYSSHVTF